MTVQPLRHSASASFKVEVRKVYYIGVGWRIPSATLLVGIIPIVARGWFDEADVIPIIHKL